MAQEIAFNLNGQPVSANVDAPTLLVDLLRDSFRLTGTHVACDTSQCGACVIHVNGCDVMTIEGIAAAEKLHPLQAAFQDCHGLQCGFCTPGMIMSALDLLNHNAEPDEVEIREWLEGNLCRCTGYHNIVRAVHAAAVTMRSGSSN